MTPENPFAATDVGLLYAKGRPFHHPRSLARLRAIVGDAPLTRALDVACGTGMSTIALAEHAPVAIGIDVSPEMLRAAPPTEGATFMLASAERLPFASASLDAVTCCSGVHWFDQQRFFSELRRVLRPGGWVGLYDHYFLGEMVDVPAFTEWTARRARPVPAPGSQPPGRRSACRHPRRFREDRRRVLRRRHRDDTRRPCRLSAHDQQFRRGGGAWHAATGAPGVVARIDRTPVRGRVHTRAALLGIDHLPTTRVGPVATAFRSRYAGSPPRHGPPEEASRR